MSFKIGFSLSDECENNTEEARVCEERTKDIRRCLAEIYFPHRGFSCTYYNDSFDLKEGDTVYVDGKLEGYKGHVIKLNYNFKIKLSDYKRVIALVDTEVKGEFFFAGSHMVTNDRYALDFAKVRNWFLPPLKEEEEFVLSGDDMPFSIDDLSDLNLSETTVQRGADYYRENRVVYLEVNNNKGRAIVKGNEYYTVEFERYGDEIRNLVCDCYCCGNCKHEFATMLQLQETLKFIEENYKFIDTDNGYFCAVSKQVFFGTAVVGKESGKLVVD